MNCYEQRERLCKLEVFAKSVKVQREKRDLLRMARTGWVLFKFATFQPAMT